MKGMFFNLLGKLHASTIDLNWWPDILRVGCDANDMFPCFVAGFDYSSLSTHT